MLKEGRIIPTQALEIPGIVGKRPLSIYLPPDYNEERPHPVAFMFDGQNLYHDEGTLAGGWHLHKVLDQRASQGLTTPIVVGIHHGSEREVEMCPWPALPGKEARAELLLNWLVGWLYKEIAQDLNILSEPQHTMVGGSSMGGLLALYSVFRYPTLFGKALVMSPSLWVDLGAIFSYIAGLNLEQHPRIYLDFGAKESIKHDRLGLEHARLMADLLRTKGLTQVHWYTDPHGEHNEYNWRRRLPEALSFLYP